MSHDTRCPTCGGSNCRRASCAEEAGIRNGRIPPHKADHDPYAYLREREQPGTEPDRKREPKQLSFDNLVLVGGPIEDILRRIERQADCGICGYRGRELTDDEWQHLSLSTDDGEPICDECRDELDLVGGDVVHANAWAEPRATA